MKTRMQVYRKERKLERDRYIEVLRLCSNIWAWHLLTPKAFKRANIEERTKPYNGAGPDKWWKWLRDIVTFFLRRFREAVLVHDFEFEISDGTRRSWRRANRRFWINMLKILKAKYNKWYSKPLYWFWYRRAWAAYQAVQTEDCYDNYRRAAAAAFPDASELAKI